MKRMTAKTIMAAAAAILLLTGCAAKDDVKLARQVVTQMVQGRYSVRKLIDWENLRAMEYSVGAEYKALANDKEREGYQKSFIDGFKRGFVDQGAKLRTFYNWRFLAKVDPTLNIVAANVHDDKFLLLVAIKHAGRTRKVVELKIIKILDPQKFREMEQGFVK
jgi:hypothetical protein